MKISTSTTSAGERAHARSPESPSAAWRTSWPASSQCLASAWRNGTSSSMMRIRARIASNLSPAKGEQTAVLAGGCFWGVDAVFKHVKGVSAVVSGYSGGGAATAHYAVVSTGTTGHAESVQITYDPSQISYSDLLRVFFSVAHDPTQLNRQGPDVGSQYRSAIFYANGDQRATAQAYIAQLGSAHVFPGPIVTEVVPFEHFYPAEAYHQ